MKHIDRGCLSGIHPGRGTSKNERLPKQLNSVFTNSKYGVALGYALLTSMFYIHNEGVQAKKEKRNLPPVTAVSISPGNGQECFNIAETDHTLTSEVEDAPKVPLIQLDYDTVKQQLFDVDSDSSMDNFAIANEAGIEISLPEALSVVWQAECSFYLSNSLKSLSNTAYLRSTDTFFF